jgi:hypothetical protein
MNALLEIVEWCRQERQRARKLIVSLETGRCRLGEDRGHGWADVTAATLSRLKLHLEELDDMLEQYEAERSRGSGSQSSDERRAS